MFLAGIGGLGAPELMVILAIVLVLFGGSRLATLGKDLGHGIREFKKATSEGMAEDQRAVATDTSAAGAGGPGAVTPAREYKPVDPGISVPAPAATVARPPDFLGS